MSMQTTPSPATASSSSSMVVTTVTTSTASRSSAATQPAGQPSTPARVGTYFASSQLSPTPTSATSGTFSS